MTRCLVTGGAGFIGCHLVEALLDAGHQVVAVDNLHLGRPEHLASCRGHPDFTFQRGDLLDPRLGEALLARHPFDVVFHLAANSDIRASLEDDQLDYDLTFRTTFEALRLCRLGGVPELVFASSSAVFGDTPEVIDEEFGPLRPVSLYGAAKLASEAFISAFCHSHGLRAWIFRFPNVVGDRATHGVIHDFLAKLRASPGRLEVLGDGRQTKPYLHVDDLVAGMLCGWRRAREQLNVLNLGVESRTTVREIAEMVVEEAGGGAEIVYGGGSRGWVGDVPSFRYDLSRIHSLGWRARHSSNEAVRLAIRSLLAG